jgi:hypothetical protein
MLAVSCTASDRLTSAFRRDACDVTVQVRRGGKKSRRPRLEQEGKQELTVPNTASRTWVMHAGKQHLALHKALSICNLSGIILTGWTW